MDETINTLEKLLNFLPDAYAFTMVKDGSREFQIFNSFMGNIVSGGHESRHPYPLIHDIVNIVFERDRVSFKPVEDFPAEFGRSYRYFLDNLLRYDKSIQEVSNLLDHMTSPEKLLFLDIFLPCLGSKLEKFIPEGKREVLITYAPKIPIDQGAFLLARKKKHGSRYANLIKAGLGAWLKQFESNGKHPIFEEEDLFVFHFYVYLRKRTGNLQLKENEDRLNEDIGLLKEYSSILRIFPHYSQDIIRKARKLQDKLVPVKEESIFSFGGYAGLRLGGNLDHAESLLPSELACMEEDPRESPDPFDVNVMENRLLFFSHEQNFSLKKKRRFHIIFWEPQDMNYRSRLLPTRWPFCFLSLIFQIVGFFRDYFSLRYYPFQFVFNKECEEGEKTSNLLNIIAKRDYPDIRITTHIHQPEQMPVYFEKEITGSARDHSCIFFTHEKYLNHKDEDKRPMVPEKFKDVHQIRVFFGSGSNTGSKTVFGIDGEKFDPVQTEKDAQNALIRLRDELTLKVVEGR